MMKRTTVIALGFLFPFIFAVLPAFASELEKGKKIYADKRCGLCHVIAGKGGKMGPDLTDVGNQRDHDWLTKFLKNPKEVVPGAKMMAVKGSEEEIAALVDYMLSLKK
ncbi:MAG: cytochrome c [Candidatus Manganitrophus sp.]|nr:cytochrome c [Candidatus Manganitrophus sp.]MDC4225558.1 cytochrome c [Candidatus Manganitrophus sp.]WDT73085.1 MAG: cytochrome c [Candidatus Manganitrophus sp.]WDT74705.1 MAG: cytochrome c [Candidatus Manganitrophus sp.]WDT79382.1 MAG: cytochrome c [Candidatus Manganitrophus sp.]